MKFCFRCKEEKPKTIFHKNKAKEDGLQLNCIPCRKEIDRNSYAKSPVRQKKIKARNIFIFNYNSKLVNRYKRFFGCKLCKEKDYIVLDLHHLDPSIKENSLSAMRKYSTETLKQEIRKCIILCSNCHRRVHAGTLQV